MNAVTVAEVITATLLTSKPVNVHIQMKFSFSAVCKCTIYCMSVLQALMHHSDQISCYKYMYVSNKIIYNYISSLLQIPLRITMLTMDKALDPYTWTIFAALGKRLPYWTVSTTKMR